ncbi:MAG: RdgB/HAM1 family non-canonical purine NTP pyrophosphatase [Chthoniobacterales bacterium]
MNLDRVLHLLIATRNPHKTREFAEILGPEFAVSDLTNAGYVPVVDETGSTFAENAILKAVSVSRTMPGLVVADDSGLEVAALAGALGIFSARYAGAAASDEENVTKLLAEMSAIDSRSARFRCALALAREGEIITVVEGAIAGKISRARESGKGFGYDPVFVPAGFEQTFASLGKETKNRISHRAKALALLRGHLGAGVNEFGLGNESPVP